jgi:hypothetical protein
LDRWLSRRSRSGTVGLICARHRCGLRVRRSGDRVYRSRRPVGRRPVAGRAIVRWTIVVVPPVVGVVIPVSHVDGGIYSGRAATVGRTGPQEDARKCQHGQYQSGYRALHCRGSPAYSHLIIPVTPPFGSTKTARLPSRSLSSGGTIANPPPATTFSSVALTSATRI